MSERCPICDGPTKTAPSGVIQVCDSADLAHNCKREPVDWRARALAAEEKQDALFAEKFGATPRLYYSQRMYLREAQDIARRALVEGLAECDRLRAVKALRDDGVVTVGRLAGRIQENRADAAREERERVVAFLNAGADDGVALLNGDGSALDDGIRKIASVLRAVAEHIANGAHTAALRGGKGE